MDDPTINEQSTLDCEDYRSGMEDGTLSIRKMALDVTIFWTHVWRLEHLRNAAKCVLVAEKTMSDQVSPKQKAASSQRF